MSVNLGKRYILWKSILSSRASSICWSIVRAILLVGLGYIILFPLLGQLSTSLMSRADIWDRTVVWLPRNINLNNFRLAFRHMQYPQAFVNSFVLVLGLSLLQLASCTLVGYGLSRFRFRGQGVIFALVIFGLIIPPQMIHIPLYLNFRFFDIFGILPTQINLLGSFWPLILTSITATGFRNGLFIYIMRQYFRGMPRALEEAAYVDGAGRLKTFLKVMLPGAGPALIIVFLFSFVWQWSDIFFINMYVPGANLLPVSLNRLAERVIGNGHHAVPAEVSLINSAGTLLFIAPLLILYIALQRHFIESVERTGLVG